MRLPMGIRQKDDQRNRNKNEAKHHPNRYREIDGKISVELKLRTPRQLFDERDPAPFRERDLDDDAAKYIFGSYREAREQGAVRLSLYFESLGEFTNNPRVIERAIHAFFQYEADVKRRELREIFREGFISLAIGLTVLFLCTWDAYIFRGQQPASLLRTMMHEGLYIMGLVAMWRPISIFLHEWWPIRAEQKTYEDLSAIEIEMLPPGVEPQDRQTSTTAIAAKKPRLTPHSAQGGLSSAAAKDYVQAEYK